MTAVRIILGAEFRAFRNRLFKRGSPRLLILAAALVIALFVLGGGIFAATAAVGHFAPAAIEPLLAGSFSALSVLMLVIGFPTVIATLFVGRDLLQLVVAPLRIAEIFVARLIIAMSTNLLLGVMLLIGVIGLGTGAGAPITYFVLTIPLIALVVVMVTAAQAVVMTAVVRVVPARVARDVAAALAGVAGTSLYIAWNFSFRQSVNRSRPNISGLKALAARIDWLPTAWPGHALSATISGDAVGTAFWAGATVILAALLMALAVVLYQQTLLSGLGVFGSTPVMWSRRSTAAKVRSAGRGAASPLAAIARKDWLAYRRDIRRLSRLLPALLFPIGYAAALSQSSRSNAGFITNLFLVAFMALFMSTALALPSVPSEKRGFQLLRLAPVTTSEILRAKILLTLPPVVLLTLMFGLVVGWLNGSGPGQLLGISVLVTWLAIGYVTIGVSAGAIDPNFEANDDRRSVGIAGSLAGTAASVGFGALSAVAFGLFWFGSAAAAGGTVLPTWVSSVHLEASAGIVMLAAGVIVALESAAIGIAMFLIANRRLSALSVVG